VTDNVFTPAEALQSLAGFVSQYRDRLAALDGHNHEVRRVTIDAAITEVVAVAMAPVLAELRALRTEVARLASAGRARRAGARACVNQAIRRARGIVDRAPCAGA